MCALWSDGGVCGSDEKEHIVSGLEGIAQAGAGVASCKGDTGPTVGDRRALAFEKHPARGLHEIGDLHGAT